MLSANVEKLVLLGGASVGTGNELDNFIVGRGKADTLSGGDGFDKIVGRSGDDTIFGGDKRDLILGGPGQDLLTGDGGSDHFRFNRTSESPANQADADIILDFSTAENDKVYLKSIDADTTTGGNQAFSFIGTGAFSSTPGELRYDVVGADLFVTADVNGNGIADFGLLIENLAAITANSFVL